MSQELGKKNQNRSCKGNSEAEKRLMKMCICSCQPGSTQVALCFPPPPRYKYTVAGKIVGGSVCI